MLSSEQVAQVVGDLAETRLAGETGRTAGLLEGLVNGPRVDALNVAVMLAGIMALDLGTDPEGGFHRIEASHVHAEGWTESISLADAVPHHAATFLQMVVALANDECRTARDLFLGFVGSDWRKALALLVFALNQTLHQNGLCPRCGPDDGGPPCSG